MNISRHFIWAGQQGFQMFQHYGAKELCRVLDPNLNVDLFLVGLSVTQEPEDLSICLVPAPCGHEPAEFVDVLAVADKFEEVSAIEQPLDSEDPYCSHLIRNRTADSFRRSLLSALRRNKTFKESEYYCSDPVRINEHFVATVLRIARQGGSREHRLPQVYADEFSWTPVSLLDAALTVFLRDCARVLASESSEKHRTSGVRPVRELLRTAGSVLMDSVLWASGASTDFVDLFEDCNAISLQRYEGAEGIGTLLISQRRHKNIHTAIGFQKPISMEQYRASRKLLEISSGGDCLLSDGQQIYGLGKKRGIYDQGNADLFTVKFTQHYTWELLHDEHRMMIVRYGEPRLPLQVIDEGKFRSDIDRVFPKRPTQDEPLNQSDVTRKWPPAPKTDRLLELANVACRQQHGTILIFSTQAESEAARLANQATLIQPTELTNELLRSVTTIDGAVLMDFSGICYAIGVILDGVATPKGDSGRGARFNSCVRYLEQQRECLALIVSEDGSVEWLLDQETELADIAF